MPVAATIEIAGKQIQRIDLLTQLDAKIPVSAAAAVVGTNSAADITRAMVSTAEAFARAWVANLRFAASSNIHGELIGSGIRCACQRVKNGGVVGVISHRTWDLKEWPVWLPGCAWRAYFALS